MVSMYIGDVIHSLDIDNGENNHTGMSVFVQVSRYIQIGTSSN